jgi:SIR2-like domain
MGHILLLGAGFSRNWGAPLANEVTGSLLGELHDDGVIAQRLRNGPFEDAFGGFHTPRGSDENSERLRRLQTSIVGLFERVNAALAATTFEFNNTVKYSIGGFLQRFDAIFTLNQDLLLEAHYLGKVVSTKLSGVVIPGMRGSYENGHPALPDVTKMTWRPHGSDSLPSKAQPYYKLHGSSNWKDDTGEPVLIMGSAKSGAIERFAILKHYHERFSSLLAQPNTKLMVIGYSFQDEHINEVIYNASTNQGLGTFIIDPVGRDVLKDPKMENAMIKAPREIENIRLIGELKRSLSAIFSGDVFAHGELMRFFP